jgi:hypothetical protein
MVWKQRVVAAVLGATVLAGCSASADRGEQVADTCDGGWSVGTPERAIRTLLEAASRGDADLACTVVTGTPEGMDLGQGLAVLKMEAEERGVAAGNVRLEKNVDANLTGLYTATGNADSELGPLQFSVIQAKDKGFRVFFPVPEELDL